MQLVANELPLVLFDTTSQTSCGQAYERSNA